MKTKKEIFDKHIEKYTLMQSTIAECMLPAMQEYADQETERLKAELEAKDKELEMDFFKIVERDVKIEELQSELNELKEKHKRDVEQAYLIGEIDSELEFENSTRNYKNQFDYYKQKFESND